MIQTRVRSFSNSSVDPTQGLGDAASSSNSATMSGVHCNVVLVSGAFSTIVSAALLKVMAFLRCPFAPSIGQTPSNMKTREDAGVSKQRRAVIIGGSMSGLLSAMLLQRNGWRVDIYERAGEELSGRGAGIVAQPELIARLDGLGLKTDDLGVHIARRQILDASGEVTHEIDCAQVVL